MFNRRDFDAGMKQLYAAQECKKDFIAFCVRCEELRYKDVFVEKDGVRMPNEKGDRGAVIYCFIETLANTVSGEN